MWVFYENGFYNVIILFFLKIVNKCNEYLLIVGYFYSVCKIKR